MRSVIVMDYEKGKPWYRQLPCIAIVISYLICGLNPGQYGVVPIVTFCLFTVAIWYKWFGLRPRFCIKIPPEIMWFELWGLWALSYVLFFEVNSLLFWIAGKMLIRQMVLLWACAVLFARSDHHKYFYWVVILVGIVQIIFSHLGFHIEKDILGRNDVVKDALDFSSSQASGLTGNANALGAIMLASVWACIMLWRELGEKKILSLRKLILLPCVSLFIYYTIQSASRKSCFSLIILIIGWVCWLIPKRLSIKSILLCLFVLVLFIVLGPIFYQYIIDNTFAGIRFQHLIDAGGGSAIEGFKSNVRYLMYVDGFKYFLNNPIAGIGLGQFGAYFYSGQYSHSDYIEPLATTGLIGFILYFGFVGTILFRLLRLLHRSLDANIIYKIKGFLLFLIVNHFIIGFGSPHYSTINHCIILLFIGVVSRRIELTLWYGVRR